MLLLEELKIEFEYLLHTLEQASSISQNIVDISDKFLYKCNPIYRREVEHNLFYFDSINFTLKNLIDMTNSIELNLEKSLDINKEDYENITKKGGSTKNVILLHSINKEKDIDIWVETGDIITDVFDKNNK